MLDSELSNEKTVHEASNVKDFGDMYDKKTPETSISATNLDDVTFKEFSDYNGFEFQPVNPSVSEQTRREEKRSVNTKKSQQSLKKKNLSNKDSENTLLKKRKLETSEKSEENFKTEKIQDQQIVKKKVGRPRIHMKDTPKNQVQMSPLTGLLTLEDQATNSVNFGMFTYQAGLMDSLGTKEDSNYIKSKKGKNRSPNSLANEPKLRKQEKKSSHSFRGSEKSLTYSGGI